MKKLIITHFFLTIICTYSYSQKATVSMIKDFEDIVDYYTGTLTVTNCGEYVYLNAKNSEIWKSDGTEEGTKLVSKKGIYYQSFTNFKNKVYFFAEDSTHGKELWVTDGTDEGTQLVKDIYPGKESSIIDVYTKFIELKNELYFCANGSLWKTDGTEKGTKQVSSKMDLYAGLDAIVFKDRLFINAADTNSNTGILFVSDGTEEGTKVFKTHSGYGEGYAIRKYSTGNKLYMQYRGVYQMRNNVPKNDTELFVISDDSTSFKKVKDIIDSGGGMVSPMIHMKDSLYFNYSSEYDQYNALYLTAGDESSTKMIYDNNNDRFFANIIINFKNKYYAFGHRLKDDIEDINIWELNHYSAKLVTYDIIDSSILKYAKLKRYKPIIINNHVFIYFQNGPDHEIYIWDGTKKATRVNDEFDTKLFKSGIEFKNSMIGISKTRNSTHAFFQIKIEDDIAKINDKESNNISNIYPNPNNGSFSIVMNDNSMNQCSMIQIYDLSGRRVYHKAVGDMTNIHTDLVPGLYILKIHTLHGEILSTKFQIN